jgi:hypothetical protein
MTESSLYIRETKIINEAKGSLLIAKKSAPNKKTEKENRY